MALAPARVVRVVQQPLQAAAAVAQRDSQGAGLPTAWCGDTPPAAPGPAADPRGDECCRDLFVEHAALDIKSFYRVLDRAGYGDLSASPFAEAIFRGFCHECDVARGVGMQSLERALRRMKACRDTFSRCAAAEGRVTRGRLPLLLRGLFEEFMQSDLSPSASRSGVEAALSSATQAAYLDEVFWRYDIDGSGAIDEAEALGMCLVLIAINDAYKDAGGQSLSKEQYSKVLVKLGFADTAKMMRGLFVDIIFQRLDSSGEGSISLPEFWTGAARLLRPVMWIQKLSQIPGWPGWPGEPAALSQKIASLRTGDVILVKIDDSMGRYLQYSMDCPWNHVAVVVRHAARPGVANLHTEELLGEYAFRRRGHVYCSPGYCRCFDDSWRTKYKPSKLDGSGVSLLESTGEGIHVYDFAHRIFESPYCKVCSAVAVRRLEGVANRDDTPRVETFIESMRGLLYTTDLGELKAGLGRGSGFERMDASSTFCSKLLAAFYRHMGWLSDDHPINVLPGDFDDGPSQLAQPVSLAQGRLGPAEMIRSA